MKKLTKIFIVLFLIVIISLVFYKSVMIGIKMMSYREEVQTPDIKGMDVDDALKVLHSKKLGMSLLEEQYSEGMPEGKIIKQFPGPGTTLKVERNVRVIVSRGKQAIKVPDLSGKSAKGSELTLTQWGLRQDQIFIFVLFRLVLKVIIQLT